MFRTFLGVAVETGHTDLETGRGTGGERGPGLAQGPGPDQRIGRGNAQILKRTREGQGTLSIVEV